ncbi:Na+/H+ antiporter subunit D [Roseinatronobacter bogoriensis]|uniref:Na+/H+ antiporter subunit D n=1 Tax=Roseinatronobacter bogoriensis subsp. barguzinensis TaxID=441209 RepID=A0A2K8K8P8_9RHOB|nr:MULTISPECIES: Na+/H+ antiporter subunit D [Rhodobaca]ATX65821.1 Na+/H+ antiporter subunit D [Rhodobaca barguzinensis]MBB4208219.1 multicomponent Na+:H+ antiporter subunit D [Rhodobaca bogoriensis DSM 18756]TDW38860.1 multisubunit sodium/proton antiporter MrpD subunit [Rhodobaca barguzinensis]TDY68957.1 multisubunit sodium/proton antiporter MrpD subunit [Rhodobaca bogoriensis DSM 18756]
MSWVLVMPIAVPFVTAVVAYLARNYPAGRWISLAGSALSLVASAVLMVAVLNEGVVAAQMSNWNAPFGITLVADYLSAVMVVITAITGLATAIYALGEIPEETESLGFYALFQVLIAGVTGAFLTGDLFNLYVWFEVMLIASFSLLVIGGGKERLDAGIKYVALNLVSTLVFLSGIGLLYGVTGTLNMADLREAVANAENQGLITVIAMMFMVGFGVKAAVFPLFFWLPASYHTPYFTISAVFAGLLTKVGVYALMRMFTLVFVGDVGFTHEILIWVSLLTMFTGVIGAAAQSDFRKILSFHIISQIGYMTLGLALFTPLALMGGVFYLVHHIIVKANLFFVAGLAKQYAGSTDLNRIGGLYKSAPLLAALFIIPAFSLAGFPPLSGFWAKYLIVKAALELDAWFIAFVSLLVGLLTIFSMTKIWGMAFWKPHPDGIDPTPDRAPARVTLAMMIPIIALASMTIVIGFYPEPFVQFAQTAAEQLLDPSDYVTTVLGVQP